MNKVLRFLTKLVLGIVAFYLVLGFVLIPLVMLWVIPSQLSKMLKHPVSLSGVFINPVTLSLDLNNFAIKDNQGQLMVGFKRFHVNVSALKLMQGQYVIEDIELDHLVVNAQLSPEGKINLMALMPAKESALISSGTPDNSVKNNQELSLPIIDIGRVYLKDIDLNFKDMTVMPNFQTRLHQLQVNINGLSTRPQAQVVIDTMAKLDDHGVIESQAMIKPLATPLELEANMKLNDYAMTVLTPYVGKYTGRTLAKGAMDFKIDYRITDNQINAGHKILIQDFTFGDKVESKDALSLPFGLAVALLEDPSGRININLPVKGDMSAPDFEYMGLLWQVTRNFFMKLVTKPFTFLMTAVLGEADTGSDDLGYIKFDLGRDQLTDDAKKQIALLVQALKERPKLRLEINGSYDEILDWKAIKTSAFQQDYDLLRKDSMRKDVWVYHTLYQRKFGVKDLWALTKKYRLANGSYDEPKIMEVIKQELIEKAPADKLALEALAMRRAKLVYDEFMALGINPEHVSIGPLKSVQGSMSKVALEFTLTVFSAGEAPVGDK